jgi:hypothetical protein
MNCAHVIPAPMIHHTELQFGDWPTPQKGDNVAPTTLFHCVHTPFLTDQFLSSQNLKHLTSTQPPQKQ